MPPLNAETFQQDPRVAQAKQLIADALADAQTSLDGVRPADPALAEGFSAMLEKFGSLRGKLWYPYIGSGIGRGPLVELADGSVKFDMINGIGVHGLGHSDPGLIAAGIDGAMGDTVMQGNLQANADAMELCEDILKLANAGGASMDHCFLTTSGAMANENALKMIFQKHAPADHIVAFRKCFTGRTLALAAVTDKAAYREGQPETLRVHYLPYVDTDDVDKSIKSAVKHLRLHLGRHKGKVAAVMFELVQGEGGYNAGDAKFHRALMEECKKQGVAVFADEIQTFGRTLKPFAFQHYGLDELIDVVAVGKMSQVCATLYKADYAPRPGLVSQTFTGSTPQIHAAREVLARMANEDWFGDTGKNATIRARFEKNILALHAKHPALFGDKLFGVGTMMAFQVHDGSADKTRATLNALFENGIIAFVCGGGPYRVRFLPPAPVMTEQDVDDVCAILETTVVQVADELARKQEAQPMMVIRPVTVNDIDGLLDLANLSTYGLTTLPKDRELLERRARHASRCFKTVEDDSHPNASGAEGQSYLFALHDTDANKLVGISGLESKLGGFHPFYYYKIETSVHQSKALEMRKEIPTLQLVAEHDGPSELCSLFLHPAYRKGGMGRVLSVSRFLFLAQFPTLFDPTVIAEMRGVIDEQGRSPFWDAVGTHFFGMDFPMADYLSIKVKELTGELLPRHPIYLPLLPKTAQAVVGKVHPRTEPALAILKKEGFDYNGWVNIFEGGPVITCHRDEIRGVRESRETIVAAIESRPIESEQYVVSVSNAGRVFAACEAKLKVEDGCVTLTREVASALEVSVGDTVRYVKLRPDAP